MLPGYKKVKLFLVPAGLLALHYVVMHLDWYNQYTLERGLKISILGNAITVLYIVSWLLHFLFFSWEFIHEKKWKPAAIIFCFLLLHSWLMHVGRSNIYGDDSSYEPPYLAWMLAPATTWFGLLYGAIKGGWKQGLQSLALGVLLSTLFVIVHKVGPGWKVDIIHWKNLLTIALIFCEGFLYFYCLNYLGNPLNFKLSLRQAGKKVPTFRTGFLLQFIMLYSYFLVAYYGFLIRLMQLNGERLSLSEFIFLVCYALAILAITHLTSNLVIQRLYEFKRPVTWRYILSFVPLINIFVIGDLVLNRRKHQKHAESLKTSTFYTKYYETDTSDTYKKVIIVLSALSYLYSIGVMANTETGFTLIFTALFYLVNIMLLAAFFSNKKMWIGLLINLVALTISRFVLDLADSSLAAAGFISGIVLIYIYKQSFHPISLDLPKPGQEASSSNIYVK